MAIINPIPPGEGRQIVSENIGEILSAQTRGAGALLRDARTEELAVADPHQSYVVSLNDLASGRMLSAARLTTWRYLIVHGSNAVAEAELNADEKAGKALDFLALHQSPFANETLEALHRAEELQQVKENDYELRYLKIPAVYLAAVWLHGKSDDILIPLPPPPTGVRANEPYSERQLINALKSLAQTAKKFDENFEQRQGKSPKK